MNFNPPVFFKQTMLFTIRGYRKFVSPMFGPKCRFYPSCSHYAEEAVDRKGIFLGLWFSLKRLLKCQPFHPGGVDFLE